MDEGTIYTFYAVRPGAGQTFTLANVGALLSLWGYRTLCVDWSLAVPGLHLFFEPWMEDAGEQPGVVELVQAQAEGRAARWRDHVTEIRFPGARQPLLFMPAGRQDASYASRALALDWDALYREHDLGAFIERMLGDWRASLDVVLVDSEWGTTDSAGICCVQLPDVLVIPVAPDEPDLARVASAIHKARRGRDEFPVDRARLLALPFAARVDERDAGWPARLSGEFGGFYREWVNRRVSSEEVCRRLALPHVRAWERDFPLPVLERGADLFAEPLLPLAALAALLAQYLDSNDLLVRDPRAFVAGASREARAAGGSPQGGAD